VTDAERPGLRSPTALEAVLDALRTRLREDGFDLIQPLQIGWYNALVVGGSQLEDFGSGGHLGIVIGNTRALWPKLLARLRADPELREVDHPVEAYTEEIIRRALSTLAVPASVRWSHERGQHPIAIQRLAHAAGLAYLSETHLSVHSEYGPWLALRAAVSLQVPAHELAQPVLAHPCGSCRAQCWPAFEKALAAASGAADRGAMQKNFRLWLAVRDACPAGRPYRYDEEQIRYHYLGDRKRLLQAALTSNATGTRNS
jgi:hypothetical protein